MSYILNDDEFPSESNWKSLDYELWVKKTYITALLEPRRITEQFLGLSQIRSKWTENLSNRWKSIGLTTEDILPSPPTSLRVLHHFSGQIDQQDKIISFMLNPRLDVHFEFEFYRPIYRALYGTDSFEYKVEKPVFYSTFYKKLENDMALQEKAANEFWNDEYNRFHLMPKLLESLIQLYDEEPNEFFKLGLKSIDDIPGWEGFRTNLEYSYYLKEGERFSDDFWNDAHRKLVAIDLLPYPSLGWKISGEKCLPYFKQILNAFEMFRTQEKTFLFFGADYRKMFERIKKVKSIAQHFPFSVTEIKKLPPFSSTSKGIYEIKLNDENDHFSSFTIICVNFRGVGFEDFKIIKKWIY